MPDRLLEPLQVKPSCGIQWTELPGSIDYGDVSDWPQIGLRDRASDGLVAEFTDRQPERGVRECQAGDE